MGLSGAVRVDADSDGQWKSARDYATELVLSHGARLPELVESLGEYDSAVVSHSYHLWVKQGGDVDAEAWRGVSEEERPAIVRGVTRYRDALRAHVIAQIEQR